MWRAASCNTARSRGRRSHRSSICRKAHLAHHQRSHLRRRDRGDAGRQHAGGQIAAGFDLRESGERRGRPQTALRIREDSHAFVGVNIHDGAITVSEVNAVCHPIGSDITEIVSNTAPQAVVEQITRMVRELAASSPDAPSPTALGLSLGGHVEDDRYVTFAPFLYWDSTVDLGGMLQRATGIPTKVFNDLDSVLLHECWFGDAIGVPRFAVITMGAGVGYSISDHGDPIDNPDKSYGLAGHVLIDPEGRAAPPGISAARNA